EPRWRCTRWQRVEESRDAWADGLVRFQEITAFQQVRVARFPTALEHKLRRPLGMLPPQFFNLRVAVGPLGDRRAPAAEDGCGLPRRTAGRGNCENIADTLRQGVGHSVCGRGDRQAEPAEIMVLVIVAVPAAVVLGYVKRQ